MTDWQEPTISTHVDPEGRPFSYVHLHRPSATGLGVHFSAFFGKWGNAKGASDFKGYFHRLKMLGSATDRSWLFLCDAYGAFENGTYYTGSAGDLFVERGMTAILDSVASEYGYDPSHTVSLGSSMGATAALKFALLRDFAGVVAIAPHIDLDTSAELQNRMEEVAWICPDGDPLSPANHGLTRQVRRLVESRHSACPLPRLFLQSAVDDHGVHMEQVRPFVELWREHGGRVELDERPEGGHTSAFATRGVLLDVVASQLADEPCDLERYRSDPELRGEVVRPGPIARTRRRLGLLRKRLRQRWRAGPREPRSRTGPASRPPG